MKNDKFHIYLDDDEYRHCLLYTSDAADEL